MKRGQGAKELWGFVFFEPTALHCTECMPHGTDRGSPRGVRMYGYMCSACSTYGRILVTSARERGGEPGVNIEQCQQHTHARTHAMASCSTLLVTVLDRDLCIDRHAQD